MAKSAQPARSISGLGDVRQLDSSFVRLYHRFVPAHWLEDLRVSECVKERMGQMLRRKIPARLLLCTAILALAVVGCHADNPCPVSMTNHSSHALRIDVGQDSLFEMYYQEFYLISPDSGFVGYYPNGTVLWLKGWIEDVRTSDTSCFGENAVGLTISGKTTFLFLNDSLGALVLRVIR